MPANLDQVLGVKALMKTIELGVGDVKTGFLPAGLLTTTEDVLCDEAELTQFADSPTVARQVAYGSPARVSGLVGAGKKNVKLIHSLEVLPIQGAQYENILSGSGMAQKLALDQVNRSLKVFFRNFANLRRACILSMLFKNAVWFDPNGQLLADSAGAAFSVGFEALATHQAQLNGIINVSWDNATADLIAQVQNLIADAMANGYELRYALHGKNVPGYVLRNNDIKALTPFNTSTNEQARRGLIPDGTLGLTWRPAVGVGYQAADGTFKSLVGDDEVLFLPEPNPSWYSLLLGSYRVPNSVVKRYADAAEAVADTTSVYGFGSYAKLTDEPPVQIKSFAFDTMLPAIYDPRAIYKATVKFT